MSEALENDFEIDEEVVETESEQETEVEEEIKEEPKHDSGYIDFDSLEQKLGKDEAAKIRNRINEDFRKSKEREREMQELNRKVEELRAKELELKKPQEIKPPTQDDWLEDPEKAQAQQLKWAESQTQLMEWQKEQKSREEAVQRAQQEAQQRQYEEYSSRAKNAKIDQAQLNYANGVVAEGLKLSQYGPHVADFLLRHEYGPQLVSKLAADQTAMIEVASLPLQEAVVKLDRMSDQFKRKTTSKAPPPDDPIRGSGAIPKDEELEGFVFE